MVLSNISLIFRALLLFISFSGLCAAISKGLKLNIFIAPYVTACCIIISLMLAGMLHILEPVFYILYAAGFAGIFYSVLTPPRKISRSACSLALTGVLFIVFLVWRFYFCPLFRNDDISHWGLVARHLLNCNTFPNADTKIVFFQSYPVGAASFIYYIGKTLNNSEGIYLVAQELLQGLLFMPLLAHIHNHKKAFYPVALAFFLLLFSFFRNMINLQVDLLLSFLGIGMVASVAYYRDDLKKALPVGLIGMVAIVYIKNSGLYFTFITALLLGYCAFRAKKTRLAVCRLVVFSFAISVVAYLIWILHIRLSYPAALETKHAVSLSAYAAEASSKNISVILQISKNFLKEVLKLSFPQFCAYAFILLCISLLCYKCKKYPSDQFDFPKLIKCLIICAGIYIVWVVMVFLMYIFSMPEDEALRTASFYRYNGTGLALLMGLIAIIFFEVFSHESHFCPRIVRCLSAFSLAFVVAFLVVSPLDTSNIPFAKRIFERHTALSMPRKGLIAAHEEYNLPNGGTYLAYCKDDNSDLGPFYEYYQVKYEFETTDIYMIVESVSGDAFLAGTKDDKELYENPSDFLTESIDKCDAVFVMDNSSDFQRILDAFLENYNGTTPIIYTYEY